MQAEIGENFRAKKRVRAGLWIVIALGIIAVFLALLRGQGPVEQRQLPHSAESFQAVFLDNGQVYFGVLKSVNQDFFSLTDIYYLRAGTLQRAAPREEGLPELDLVKLGAELHAPRDEMLINKAHILFYEDIREDGEVMKLIRAHKSR